jgi:Na+/H+ antiporter NhaD/arsenite permease-like protein
MRSLAELIAHAKNMPPVVFGLILLWGVAILSALVDNVPITIALIPVIQGLGAAGMDINPLWWALVFGAGLGGNGTIIGSTANIVVTSVSDKTETPITPKIWNKYGLPVMLGTCLVASVLYIMFFYLVY